MIIEQEILNRWKLLREYGDVTKISEESNISRNTLSIAINTGEATEETVKAISEFYDRREARIKKLPKVSI